MINWLTNKLQKGQYGIQITELYHVIRKMPFDRVSGALMRAHEFRVALSHSFNGIEDMLFFPEDYELEDKKAILDFIIKNIRESYSAQQRLLTSLKKIGADNKFSEIIYLEIRSGMQIWVATLVGSDYEKEKVKEIWSLLSKSCQFMREAYSFRELISDISGQETDLIGEFETYIELSKFIPPLYRCIY